MKKKKKELRTKTNQGGAILLSCTNLDRVDLGIDT